MNAAADRPWRVTKNGVVLRVRLTPRSSRDGIDGIEVTADGPAIKARVRALPEDGAANAAIEKLIATWLGVAKRDVTVIAGGKSRVKSLAVAGDAAQITAALDMLLAGLD